MDYLLIICKNSSLKERINYSGRFEAVVRGKKMMPTMFEDSLFLLSIGIFLFYEKGKPNE